MPNVVLVVEGEGDVDSFPDVVGRIGAQIGEVLFSGRPIRVGGWLGLRRPGKLEKWCRVASQREDCSRIVIVLDLDDLCPVEEREAIEERRAGLQNELGLPIEICFCIREFEAWLLAVVDILAERCPEYGWQDSDPPANYHKIRDAKGALRSKMNVPYGEATDQSVLARAIPCDLLFQRDRSFRRFVKAVSGFDYDLLGAALE